MPSGAERQGVGLGRAEEAGEGSLGRMQACEWPGGVGNMVGDGIRLRNEIEYWLEIEEGGWLEESTWEEDRHWGDPGTLGCMRNMEE